MTTITLDITQHKGKQILLLKFPYDQQLINLTKKLPNASWSKTHKSWYTSYSMDILKQVKQLFTDVAIIDANILKEKSERLKNAPPDIKNYVLNEDAKKSIEKFENWMHSRRYSDGTIGTYTDALKTFLKFYSNKSIAEITHEDVIAFNNKYILANNYSASYQNQVVNAIKLFFRTVQNTSINIDLIHRPKNPKLLPNVLSKEEVQRILKSTKNLKHKTALSLVYSCGLRRSELLNLKIKDVNSDRNLLIIRSAKGNKDRVAPLSEKIIELLRSYYTDYKPKTYLFEGWVTGTQYSEKSLQQVLKNSVTLANIKKPVSLHWLRHSYATHLLENGTDLRYIQEILGHKSSKTTEIYTHVSNKQLAKIKTPFDDLDL